MLLMAFALVGCEGAEEAVTILELPPRLTRTCSVSSPTTVIADTMVQGFSLNAGDSGVAVFTSRYDDTVSLSRLNLDPIVLDPALWTAGTAWDTTSSPMIAEREGGGWVLAWSELLVDTTVNSRLGIAAVDAAGTQLGAVRYLPTDPDVYVTDLVTRPDGFALAWAAPTKSSFVMLDLDGVPTGPPVTLTTAPASSAHLTPYGDGFAVAWGQYDDDRFEVDAALLDAEGRLGEAKRIWTSGPRRLGSDVSFIRSYAGGLLIAWVESFHPEDPDDENGYAIIRVARLTDTGDVVEPQFQLQAPELGFVNVNVSVLSRPDVITLAWSHGDYVTNCGGCFSDNRMRLVQLDPADLTPVSNVVELAGPSGLRSAPIASADGTEYAFLLAIDYHARFDLGAATVRCSPSP